MIEEKSINPHPVYSEYGASYNGIVYSAKSGEWKPIAVANHGRGYKQFKMYYTKHGSKMYLAHRFIWECFNDIIPDGMCIHHIDNDKVNNHIDNLQMVTDAENRRLAILDGIPQGAASPNYNRTK